MDQPRNNAFAKILSRSATNRSSSPSVARTNTKLSLLNLSDDEKGVLGLSTLYEPPKDASANIIFIHGLGGGSRKTWSISPDIQHFWPLQWLPEDPDFRTVRILTFGYKADWGERSQSVLNIHDFAQSLIGELRNHPSIRRDTTRIVLVGHSMGGCVAKKAYIIARQDPTCKGLVERFHSMFFLGTPHRGSDLAAVLESMLVVAWRKKPFVTDLTPNSAALTELNDAFRHFAPELRLWSFYETLPVKLKVMNKVVVERASATLGYANEEIAAMNADHRHVCKFESPADPNFRMLRNALHTAVDMIQSISDSPPGYVGVESAQVSQKGYTPAEMTARLSAFLGVHDDGLDDDLAGLQVLKEPGSCLWFSDGAEFATWNSGKGADIFWLTGRPASGKSVLSSHIIDILRPADLFCSYFFFRQGKTGKSTLSDCLRSLAFQMASQDTILRDKLFILEEGGANWDKADEISLWRKIFVSVVFQLPTIGHHVWVIDALDECTNFNALFTKRLLATTPSGLRLFVTSRDLEEIGRGVVSLGPRVTTKALSEADTVADMRLLLSMKLKELDRLDDDESREAMSEKILKKSSGSFLWVRLVLQEFENTWTQEAMEAVLEEIPDDLYDMYTRMVQSIEVDKRKVTLAKSILTWVVLASRPLTLDELRCAVRLDINQTLQNMEKAIPSICGQLVSIDQKMKVHMIHETAREFFISGDLMSELSIHKALAHTRLASLSLQYLSGDVLKARPTKALPSRTRGFGKPTASAAPDLSLLEYTSQFFSDHICRGTSENDELTDLLCEFLKRPNILAWIEHIAEGNELSKITRTAMNLRGYLGLRTKYVPPTDPSVYLVDSWITDLIRVAAKFRAQLLACPSSIHCLIPSLCPTDSIIARTFAKHARGSLTVKGLPQGSWDDCLIRIDFQKGQTTAVRHGDKYFAVGLSTGQISLYGTGAFQQVQIMKHPERIRLLEFGPGDEFLVSVGTKFAVIWEPKLGKLLRTLPLPSPPLAIAFLGTQELLCAFQSSCITKWDIDTGESATISWKEEDDFGPAEFDVPDQPPSRMAFLTAGDDVLLAVGYRSHPIFIWNALELQVMGQCGADFNNGIDDMAFNPNPEVVSLVVSYNNGVLCLFDYTTMEMTFKQPDVHAHSLACSPDGRSLVTGSNQGIIEVFEFDQDYSGNIVLLLIHRINAFDDSIRSIAFNYDGLHFVDVRGQQCRVWAPAALVRKDNELESTSDAVPLPPKTVGMLDVSEEPEITSRLVVSNDGAWAIAGKSNGSVALFSASDGSAVGSLCQHARGVSVTNVALGEQRNLIISADDSGRVLITKIATRPFEVGQNVQPPAATVVFERRLRTSVVDLLVNDAADRLLLTRRDLIELWELPSGLVLGRWPAENDSNSLFPDGPPPRPVTPVSSRSRSPWRSEVAATTFPRTAIPHPTNADWLIITSEGTARILSWVDLTEQTPAYGIRLGQTLPPSLDAEPQGNPGQVTTASVQLPVSAYQGTVSFHVGPGIILEHRHASPTTTSRILIWPAAVFDPSSSTPAQPSSDTNIEAIESTVHTVIGFTASTLLFLDTALWVCSTELSSAKGAAEKRPTSSLTGSTNRSLPQSSVSIGLNSSSELKKGRKELPHATRHFFALSEWRSGNGQLRCALGNGVGTPAASGVQRHSHSQDVFFATSHSVIVVKDGLEFSEEVRATGLPTGGGSGRPQENNGAGAVVGHHNWKTVSGRMHRRGSHW